jgi:sulfur carrier protein ThiS
MTITIAVKLVGILKQHAPDYDSAGFEVNLPEHSQLADLVRALEIPTDQIGLAVVNQQRLTGPQALHEGDQVLLFPPMVAGG